MQAEQDAFFSLLHFAEILQKCEKALFCLKDLQGCLDVVASNPGRVKISLVAVACVVVVVCCWETGRNLSVILRGPRVFSLGFGESLLGCIFPKELGGGRKKWMGWIGAGVFSFLRCDFAALK